MFIKLLFLIVNFSIGHCNLTVITKSITIFFLGGIYVFHVICTNSPRGIYSNVGIMHFHPVYPPDSLICLYSSLNLAL